MGGWGRGLSLFPKSHYLNGAGEKTESSSCPEVIKVHFLEKPCPSRETVHYLLPCLLMWKLPWGSFSLDCSTSFARSFASLTILPGVCAPGLELMCQVSLSFPSMEGFVGKEPTVGPPFGWQRSNLSRPLFLLRCLSLFPWALCWLLHRSGEGAGEGPGRTQAWTS